MRETKPFFPHGKTIKVAADTTAPTGVATVSPDNKVEQYVQYRVQNNGTETVFYAYGVDASTAQTNAVIPTGSGSNSKDAYPLSAGGIEVISAPRNSFWSGITVTGAVSLYVTPGDGV